MPKLWTQPIENQFSIFENTQMLFPNSITHAQIFKVWVMETSTQNQAKHKIFCGTHAFWKLSNENWVILLKISVIQTGSNTLAESSDQLELDAKTPKSISFLFFWNPPPIQQYINYIICYYHKDYIFKVKQSKQTYIKGKPEVHKSLVLAQT